MKRAATLLALALALAHVLVIGPRRAAAEPPAPYALIVGRDAPGPIDEEGAATAHQRRIAELLRREYGYPARNVVELYGKLATQERIVKALDSLQERMRKGDSLFLYLSLPWILRGREVFLVPKGGKAGVRWTLISLEEVYDLLVTMSDRPGLLIFPECTAVGGSTLSRIARGGAPSALTFCPSRDPIRIRARFAEALATALSNRARSGSEWSPRLLATHVQAVVPEAEVQLAGAEEGLVLVRSREKLMAAVGRLASMDAAAIEVASQIVREAPPEWRGELADVAAGALSTLAASEGVEPAVRYRAVQALGEIGHVPSVRALGSLLASEDQNLRRAVVEALGQIAGDESAAHLRRAISDRDPRVGAAATRAAGIRRDGKAVEPILSALAHNPESEEAIAALQALASLERRDKEVVRAVARLIGHGDVEVRREVVATLAALGGGHADSARLVALAAEDPAVRQAAAYALGRSFRELDRPMVERALLHAVEPRNPGAVREAACWSLGEIGGAVAEGKLVELLADEDEKVRRTAADGLGRIRSTRAVDRLALIVEEDDDAEVRRAAGVALGKIGDPRAIHPLFQALKDENSYVRLEADRSLKAIRAVPTVEQLAPQLGDPEPAVRRSAVEKLGTARGPAVTSALIDALDDDDYGVRQAAVAALASFRDADAHGQLVVALDDPSFLKRGGVAVVLGRLGNPRSIEPLLRHVGDPYSGVRAEVVRSLSRLDVPPLDIFLHAATDPDASVRLVAVDALAESGGSEALAALERLADDPVSEVRLRAVEVLRQLHPEPSGA